MSKTIFNTGILIVGILFFCVGITHFITKIDLILHSTTTVGYVKDNISHRGNRADTYQPLIEFSPTAGEKYTFESDFSSAPPKYSVGQKVEILFNPADPKNAELNDPWALWATSTVLTILGIAFLSLAVINLPKRRKGI